MTTQSATQKPTATADRIPNANAVLGFVIIGLLAAGTVGVLQALAMHSGFDVLLCLLGSVASFGAVYYIYFGKH